ncbi:hypothetical protein JRO89_XSUnG0016000 [Xanthoceras sorbifolium]|uniref:DUF4283 domain-containing protein n=1 Tax=Xanthoceras sorbifolium TaxID=99658 RepID=A0ABQ8H0B8_9ROSI|nr:hypothetical protein JRO89_XSUnG0016000 [Xanthoceras sorbifolium]
MNADEVVALCSSFSLEADEMDPRMKLEAPLKKLGERKLALCLVVLEELHGDGKLLDMKFNCVELWIQLHNVPLICMIKEIGWELGKHVGKVIDIDVGATGDCLGKYLRVRVVIEVDNPLKRCLRVGMSEDTADTVLLDETSNGSHRFPQNKKLISTIVPNVNIPTASDSVGEGCNLKTTSTLKLLPHTFAKMSPSLTLIILEKDVDNDLAMHGMLSSFVGDEEHILQSHWSEGIEVSDNCVGQFEAVLKDETMLGYDVGEPNRVCEIGPKKGRWKRLVRDTKLDNDGLGVTLQLEKRTLADGTQLQSMKTKKGLLDAAGIWCTDRSEMEQIISSYFANIFTFVEPSGLEIKGVLGCMEPRLPVDTPSVMPLPGKMLISNIEKNLDRTFDAIDST